MSDRFPPIITGQDRLLHGGDYNPDQWQAHPAAIDEDFRLMPVAGVNIVSVAVFGWARLEPEEGRYAFGWLDEIMDRVAAMGGTVALASPSAARPPWLAKRYRETSRIDRNGRRESYDGRHNHCYSSPVMRARIAAVTGALAERYAAHPALGLWHISNEYGGECFCEYCQAAWWRYLEERYGAIDRLNAAWWADFWGHRFSAWDEITPGDGTLDAQKLDWSRFVTDRTVDFMQHEIAAVRRFSDKPVTSNFMGTFPMLDYRRFAPHIDVIANDWYPAYNVDRDLPTQAAHQGFVHDLMRGLKGGQPWLLMESTPSTTNWQAVGKLKRPGQHRLEGLQAVAHGSDSVMYFQWRKGRGGAEKMHGGVIDHAGGSDARVFREVAALGADLARLGGVRGLPVDARIALVYDWETRWTHEQNMGPARQSPYEQVCVEFYRAAWRRNLPVDVIGRDDPLDGYQVVLAPMLNLVTPALVERVRAFVEAGGSFCTTFLSGMVDECATCHPGGWPGGGLREVLGILVEEHDVLYPDDEQVLEGVGDLAGRYPVQQHCDLFHCQGAEILARYGAQFYAGAPAASVHRVGEGRAYYLGARSAACADALVAAVAAGHDLAAPMPAEDGVSVRRRSGDGVDYAFLLNWTTGTRRAEPGPGWVDAEDGTPVAAALDLGPLASRVLRRG